MVKTFVLSENSKTDLYNLFINIDSNPYQDYMAFKEEINQLIILSSNSFNEIKSILKTIQEERNNKISYAHLIKNLPVDVNIPKFETSASVEEKYLLKKSFVGESVLEMASFFTETPILAYDTRTNGDFFHDVYPIDKYKGTQTQKTDGELFFHNDRTAHPIRADYLYLLGMTKNDKNNIYTGYIDGRNILKFLTEEEQMLLREAYFYTPYDEYSKDSNKNQINSAYHAILIDEHSFRYYDTRTTYVPDAPVKYIKALLSLKNALTKSEKEYVKITKGDLFLFANLQSLHSKQLIQVNDIEEASHRWLLKTYNFKSINQLNNFSQYFHKDIPGLVKDSLVEPS